MKLNRKTTPCRRHPSLSISPTSFTNRIDPEIRQPNNIHFLIPSSLAEEGKGAHETAPSSPCGEWLSIRRNTEQHELPNRISLCPFLPLSLPSLPLCSFLPSAPFHLQCLPPTFASFPMISPPHIQCHFSIDA